MVCHILLVNYFSATIAIVEKRVKLGNCRSEWEYIYKEKELLHSDPLSLILMDPQSYNMFTN